ncbi:unnamed protein product (macronuclear) [Paramecium tetraurelia]|uniref:Uncharacterized protein n=1 Tax=Paramecium tetraurelia TaxID=5888 RepID=A0CKS4_PARTE|nr:uncharacterized protein GSPATT00007937001 [Paramecium tetraurelia]CAK71391.1 unnamed protein product [Paramecium tetraurelia]|eukprot:XP_001438788.1 hypothetical protein (macronuclear) [Paramecium tetraurelia strain d4-2]
MENGLNIKQNLVSIKQSLSISFSQVIYVGQYRYGQKYDQWIAMYREHSQTEYQIVQISHPYKSVEEESIMKKEKSMESGMSYLQITELILLENIMDYMKMDRNKESGISSLKIKECKIFQPICKSGGGDYNNDGVKTGKWIELMDNFYRQCYVSKYFSQSQVIYVGMYQGGRKIGQWQTLYRWNQANQFTEIGGGLYDKNGQKKGNWIDIHEQFWNWMQVKFRGGYYKGLKVGIWDTIYDEKAIGGGLYNQDEIKTGKWIELAENYNKYLFALVRQEFVQQLLQVNISQEQNQEDGIF